MDNCHIILVVGFFCFCVELFGAAWVMGLFNLMGKIMKKTMEIIKKTLSLLLFGKDVKANEPKKIDKKEVKGVLSKVMNNPSNKGDIEDFISLVDKDLDFAFQLRDAENKNIVSYVALVIALGSAFVFCFNNVDNLSEDYHFRLIGFFLIGFYLFFYILAVGYVYKSISIKFDLPVSSLRNIEYYYGPNNANHDEQIKCLAHNILVAEGCINGVKVKLDAFRKSKQLIIRSSIALLLFVFVVLIAKYFGYYVEK